MVDANLINQFRLKVTLNHFKRSVLNDLHVANKSQVNALFSSFESINTGTILTERTWQTWFSSKPVMPKKLKLNELKKIANKLGCEFDGVFLNDDFEAMALGLQINQIASSIKKNQFSNASQNFLERNCSSVQLFLNSIQLSSYSLSCEPKVRLVIEVLANNALKEIHLRWNPISGYLYLKLPSDLRTTYEKASAIERILIQKRFEKFKPNIFIYLFNSHPIPKQAKSFIIEDVEPKLIYKFFVGLTSDLSFLNTRERSKIWIFELVSSILILKLIHRINRGDNKIFITNEMVSCEVLFELLIYLLKNDEIPPSIQMEFLEHFEDFQIEQFDILKKGIQLFKNELDELGVKFEDILDLVR